MKNKNFKKSIRTAVIGTGRIAFVLEKDNLRYKPCTHIGALIALNKRKYHIDFKYLCDIKPERLQELRLYLNNNNIDTKNTIFLDNYDQIDFNQLDLLIISSDTYTHFNILKLAIKNNVSKIITEKPIFMNNRESLKIKKLIRNSASKIWINYERRFHPSYNHIHQIIHNKKPLGKALSYCGFLITKNDNFFSTGMNEGILLHDTTHLLDTVQYLFGKISNKPKHIVEKNTHSIDLYHKNNDILGSIKTIKNANYFHFEIQIYFEQGKITTGNGFYYMETSKKSKYYSGFNSLADKENKLISISEKNNPFMNLYENVITGKYCNEALEDALDNINILYF